MWSVRVTAVGAVIVASLSFLTGPARACDDRFIKKCEKQAAAAAAAAEESAAGPVARRKSAKRVNVVNSRRSRHTRLVKRSRAPGFTIRRERETTAARMTALLPESVLARRFRGFIDPQPIAHNAFELLRRPQLVALNFEPAAMAPLADVADNASPVVAETEAPSVVTPKQDRMASKPAAMELASAESKRVTLAEPAPPPAAPPPAEPAKPQQILTEAPAPPPASDQPSQFSFHKLVLALCGALGAASALRFIVGA